MQLDTNEIRRAAEEGIRLIRKRHPECITPIQAAANARMIRALCEFAASSANLVDTLLAENDTLKEELARMSAEHGRRHPDDNLAVQS